MYWLILRFRDKVMDVRALHAGSTTLLTFGSFNVHDGETSSGHEWIEDLLHARRLTVIMLRDCIGSAKWAEE